VKLRIPADFLQIAAQWLVSNAEAILIMCTPLVAPLPSMFAAIRALEKGGWGYANLMGAIIEMLGLAAGAFMGYVENHNQRNPAERISPRWGYGLFVFYLVVIEALILVNDPNWVSALLPGLTVIGAIIVGFRRVMLRAEERQKILAQKQDEKDKVEQQHGEAVFSLDLEIKRREAEQRLALQQAEHSQKLELERKRVETRLSTVNRQPVDKVDKEQAATPEDTPVDSQTVDKMLEIYKVNPKASLRKVGGIIGLSHTGVSKALDKLESQGVIHRNGHGVEILA
jgi:hypothetical protein